MLDPERTEVRRNGEWLDMPMEDLFRLARTSTVAQLLERDDFAKRYAARRADLDPRAALPAAPGLRLGGRRRRTSSSAAPTRSSTCCSARDIQQAYGVRAAVDPHDADPAGHRRRAEDVEVARQLRGRRPSRPRRCSASSCGSRTTAMPIYYELLLDEPLDPALPPREPEARAWRAALTARFHGDGGRRGGRGALRPPARGARACPDDVEEHAFARRQRHGPPAGAAGRRLRALALGGRGGCSPRRGVKLDGEPLDESAARPAGRAARRRGAPGRASGASSGFDSADVDPSAVVAGPSAVLHCSVALGTPVGSPAARGRTVFENSAVRATERSRPGSIASEVRPAASRFGLRRGA